MPLCRVVIYASVNRVQHKSRRWPQQKRNKIRTTTRKKSTHTVHFVTKLWTRQLKFIYHKHIIISKKIYIRTYKTILFITSRYLHLLSSLGTSFLVRPSPPSCTLGALPSFFFREEANTEDDVKTNSARRGEDWSILDEHQSTVGYTA